MAKGRVFVLESPNPLDLLEDRGERDALQQVCRLAGHDTSTFVVRDTAEFKQTCGYISSIKGDKGDKTPLFLHISLHGNASGIGMGRDSMNWSGVAATVQDMYDSLQYYHGPVVLILSACGANKQKLTAELTRLLKNSTETYVPPEYVFVFAQDTVTWADSVVTWTIFYRQVTKINFFTDKTKIQELLSRIKTAGFGDLKYFRWDKSSKGYKFYPKN